MYSFICALICVILTCILLCDVLELVHTWCQTVFLIPDFVSISEMFSCSLLTCFMWIWMNECIERCLVVWQSTRYSKLFESSVLFILEFANVLKFCYDTHSVEYLFWRGWLIDWLIDCLTCTSCDCDVLCRNVTVTSWRAKSCSLDTCQRPKLCSTQFCDSLLPSTKR